MSKQLSTKEKLEKLKELGYEIERDYFPDDDDCEWYMLSPDGKKFTGELRSNVIDDAYSYMLERVELEELRVIHKWLIDYAKFGASLEYDRSKQRFEAYTMDNRYLGTGYGTTPYDAVISFLEDSRNKVEVHD
jgi:hypothetical protein